VEPYLAPDGDLRCAWAGGAPEFLAYHDTEWGFPVSDDIRLFEKICLEGFQSGLSWRTILNKRENFRKAFAGFDFHRVAQFDDADVTRLLGDPGIVRHRGKIEVALSKDLKKRGWRFVGPTTAYAFIQAMGLINDHQHECKTRAEVDAARRMFVPPASI